MYYILEGREIKNAERDEWLEWMKEERVIEQTFYEWIEEQDADGRIMVSTVFLGLGASWMKHPLLFETMIFRNGIGRECVRCSSYDEAERMHQNVCAQLKAEFGEKLTKMINEPII